MDSKPYNASWTGRLTTSTALLSVACLGVTVLLVAMAAARSGGARWLLLPGAALTLAAVLGSAALAPRAYVLSGAGIDIQRMAGRLRIPRSEIQEVQVLAADAQAGAIRLFGVWGLFGYFGHFQSAGLGRYRLYATRMHPAVAIKTSRGFVVVTPDDVEGFIADARRVLASSSAP